MSTTMAMTPSRRVSAPISRSINLDADAEYQRAVNDFLAAKDRPFVVSGQIPIPAEQQLILFFRTSSGISHSLPFPLKPDSLNQLPALNVLLAACEAIPNTTFDESIPITENTEHELPLVWPSQLPFSMTFELANHPVLDAIRSILFPKCSPGSYLFLQRSRLEIILAGARSEPRRPSSPRGIDGAKKVATLVVTLPVPFRGGALVVRTTEGISEYIVPPSELFNTDGNTGLHWTAFLADCEHEFEFVEQGCRMSISYAVYTKSFGPVGPRPNPLIVPNDELLDALSKILNITRGRRLGIHLTGRYGCAPGEVLADSLVPSLKGCDATLYHALKLYKLTPELRWTAAGYIWPADKTVRLNLSSANEDLQALSRVNLSYPYSVHSSPLGQGGIKSRQQSVSRPGVGYEVLPRSPISDDYVDDEDNELLDRIVEGGALPLRETEIVLLTARDRSVSKEKVPFVSRGKVDRLLVNILMVVYVQ